MDEPMNEGAMQPIDDGLLRAYLDGDSVLDDTARDRIAAALVEQPTLAGRLAALRADAAVVDGAFARFAPPEPDAMHRERAYRRVQTRLTTKRHASFAMNIKERVADMTNYNRAARVRRYAFAGSLGAVALVLLLVFAPVTSAFNAVISTFSYQPTKFAVITINTSDFPQFQGAAPNGATGAKPGTGANPATGSKPAGSPAPTAQDQQKLMQELSKYVSITSPLMQAQTSSQLPGREIKCAPGTQPPTAGCPAALPKDLAALPDAAKTPHYYVVDHQTADATLHLNEIRPILAQAGMASLVPATGDSATVHVDLPTASIVSYGFDPTAQGDAAKNQKGIAVAALGSPTIDVNGLDVPGIVNTISALPNLPPELVAQLKTADLQHTLIIPVTSDQMVKNGTIGGAPSTTISQKDGSMSVVLWITTNNKISTLHVAAGTYPATVMEKVAASVN